jgi:hypothetical protein
MRTHKAGRVPLALLALLLAAPGCYEDDDDDFDDDDFVTGPGKVAGDFQSLADYFDDPVVRRLFDFMPRASDGVPPDVGGSYDSTGVVEVTSIPGTSPGTPVASQFCFGTPAGANIEVVVADPSVVDDGAASFIEGNGDVFTVYTAFKSVQTGSGGGTCEIHQVNIFSGRRNSDGSLSDLEIGLGIVGLIGDCFPFLIGDIQVSDNIADLIGPPCSGGNGGQVPGDPRNVLVGVENNLVTGLLVFIDDEVQPSLVLDALSADTFETRPGFDLFFESIQPSAGTDDQGDELLMGEIVAGQFQTDTTPAGEAVAYIIEHRVGSDTFFAPLPLNRRQRDIFSVVNIAVDVPGYPPPAGSGLDCLCLMPPSPGTDPYVIGYYSYSAPGILTANQANVHFFDAVNSNEVAAFQGPFNLEELTGTVTLLVR